MAFQILCTKKLATGSDRITHIGGKNSDTERWRMTEADAIKAMEDNRKYEFFVKVNSRRSNVIISKLGDGTKYLRTESDGYTENNLGSLPDCP